MTSPLFSRDWDVLVAGGGNAALCAAITARRAGARVLVVEAAPKFYRGGNTRHTRNMRVAHDEPNEVLTGPYPEDEFWEDLLRVTGGNTDEQLARFTLSQSKELWDYMSSLGVRFQPSLTGSLSLGRTNAFFLGGGKSLMNALYRTAEAEGVAVVYDAEVTAVEIEGAEFRAAEVTHGGEATRVPARAFVAAAGGFEANIEWLEEYWGPAARNFRIRGTPYNRGSLLRTMLDAGAQPVGEPDQCHAVAIDARAPQFDGGIATRLDCIVFGMVVNREAERFYDEGEDFWPKRYAIWGRLVAAQPEQMAYAIIDSRSVELFMPSIFPAITADTMEEMAAKLDLPPDRLRATWEGFNAAVRPGAFDPAALDGCRTEGLSPEKTNWARRIETPPFHAYPLSPGITFTYLGLKVDREARVQAASGGAFENIYAAGEIMAGNVLGKGYLAGIGMTIGSVFGRLAGRGAATHVA
ncbi:MAG: FAD-dependent tricarballylate dehydrogenase TcuA [Pseudomonadota bacterium]|nr:FAD-dependent tricarballylate dehydrogenase TcuA [Pseudomonadota bacterium]